MQEITLACLLLGLPADLILQDFLRIIFANKLIYQIVQNIFKITNFCISVLELYLLKILGSVCGSSKRYFSLVFEQ
jgi:hypothetical protein